MKAFLIIVFFFLLISLGLVRCIISENKIDRVQETQQILTAINNVLGWAVKKEFNLFFNTISDDSNFISVTPYKKVKFGVEDVKKDTGFWASLHFKAIRHELRELKIRISKSGDTAWFFCYLDDINEWKGQPVNWENARWTGVLEKRNGRWRVVQQHFSFPKD
jgi:ketosteroid isomerase-like protein